MWGFVLLVLIALYVGFDASRRRANALAWFLGSLVLGVVFVPLYFAKRPLLAGEVREGGTGWNVLRNWAILWTVVMLGGGIMAMVASVGVMSSTQNEYEAAGAAIGTGLGMGLIGMLWFFPVVGALVLGLLVRKSSVVERGPTGTPGTADAPARNAVTVAATAVPNAPADPAPAQPAPVVVR